MNILFKVIACVLMTVVLGNTIPKDRKELSLLLSIAVCCMVSITALSYLKPVFSFIDEIQLIAQLNTDSLAILMKVVGISVTVEITSLICKDIGNDAVGKSLQFLATAMILCFALPLFEELLILIEKALEAV